MTRPESEIRLRAHARPAVLLAFLAAFVTLFLGGCGSTCDLRIVFEPRDAVVKVTSPGSGVSTLAAQPGAAEGLKVSPNAGVVPMTLRFPSPSAKYTIAVSREGHRTFTRTVDQSVAQSLPKSGSLTVLNVNLPRAYSVRFITEPLGAALRLTDPDGQNQLIRPGQDVDLYLGTDGRSYKVAATADGYVRQEFNVDLSRVTEAIRDNGGVIRMELPSVAFIDMKQLMVVYDSRAGFVGKYRNVRAWKQDSLAREKPVRLFDFPDHLGVRGLTATPDARQLVYSIAEIGTPPPSAVDAEDPAAAASVAAVSLKTCRLRSLTLFQGRGVGEMPSTEYIDIDPFFLSDAGTTLMFTSNGRNRRSTADILAVSQASPDEVRILQRGTAEAAVSNASAGADGTMAFVRTPNGESGVPAVMVLDGKRRAIEARPTPLKIANATQPCVSPDGSRVAYIDRDSANVMVFDHQSGKSIALTHKGREIREFLRSRQPGYDPELSPPYANPAWSPDGRYLIYTGIDALDRNGRPNEDIWVVSAAGGAAPIALTNDGSADIMPCWARDNSIYFVSNRGGKWTLYRLPAPSLNP